MMLKDGISLKGSIRKVDKTLWCEDVCRIFNVCDFAIKVIHKDIDMPRQLR